MTEIVVKHRAPALHYWADAPVHRDYLRVPHRHLFTYVVRLEVHHGDREVEFHDVLQWLAARVCVDWGGRSCENIAADLRMAMLSRQPNHVRCTVEVWEDDECGAVVSGD